jgi:hypothetical protein
MRRADAASDPVSALMECRLLKRKCGSICARSIRNFGFARKDLHLQRLSLRGPHASTTAIR